MPPYKKLLISNEVLHQMVNEIKTRECLWNPEDPHHNDRFHILTAWREISKIMDMPEQIIKTKWKHLRDIFKREVKRHNVKSIEEYNGKWRHFHVVSFIHQPGESEENDNNDDMEENPLEVMPAPQENPLKLEPVEHDEIEAYIDDMSDPIPDKRRRYTEDDYDMMYLKSLTPYFRQLEPVRKLVLRSKIQDMLMNEIAAQGALNRTQNKKS